jgi:IclR family transcriptional regulator, acetate operon repressor
METVSVPYHGTGADAVHRALDVLLRVGAAPGRVGVTELARAVGLPKSTAHRLLEVLRQRGMLEKDGRGRYGTGAELLRMGLRALEGDPLLGAVRPALEELAIHAGETAFLVAARGGRLLVLDRVEGAGMLRATPPLGSEVPVHATAAGRLYLALKPAAVALPVGRLAAFTARTPTSRSGLTAAARRAAARGWDANVDEWIVGMTVVSAPIVAHATLHGVLAVAGATPRLQALGLESLAALVMASAAGVAARLPRGAT